MKLHLLTLLCLLTALTTWSKSSQSEGTGKIFVSNEMDNTISVIDAIRYEVIKTIPVGERPRDMQWHKIKPNS